MDAEQENGLKQGMQLYGNESNKWNRMRNDPNLNLQNFTSAQLLREWTRLGEIGDDDHLQIEGQLAFQRAREVNNLRIGMARHGNQRNKWELIRADGELGLVHKNARQLAHMWQNIEDLDLDSDEELAVM
ncbi:hypothetical protein P8452_70503 [Trifolium repens]|nr:hypothetical protein P8452_70503 [Trifolium repens]